MALATAALVLILIPTMQTSTEINAQIETVKAQIAAEKLNQARRQLDREKRRMALEDVADRNLAVEIQRAETNLESKKVALQADKIALRGERDRVRYLEAKNVINQRLMVTELQQLEINLAGSQRKLDELRNVAQTLDHKIEAVVPKNLFSSGGGHE